MIELVSLEDFKRVVLDAKLPVLVDFYADWCGPCRVLGKELESLQDSDLKCTVVKLNVDDLAQIASEYDVMSIPTMIMFNSGKEIVRYAGTMKKQEIIKWVGDVVNAL